VATNPEASVAPEGAPAVPEGPPSGEPPGSLLHVDGPSGALRVWFGGAGDRSALEADVREVSDRGIRRLAVLAVALGDVVRVVPRMQADGPSILVLFGSRANRAR
jgi:hypothetical protein